jgi:hypothetical protein
MEEGMSTKAIPLRRSRGTSRVGGEPSPGLIDRLGSGLRLTISPIHALWLAGLGGTSLAIRSTGAIWASLTSEGASVEGWFRSLLGR